MKAEESGLRKHRPKKKFRFEYIQGKYCGMNKKRRETRLFAELEREEWGHENLQESLKEYWKDKK